jgi:2-amino-4-hydroxy-6-hydroxymethyldihydropteridine diphosphokinase
MRIIKASKEPRHEAKNALKKLMYQKLGYKNTQRASGKKTASYLSHPMKLYPVFLVLGGNLGDRKSNLEKAVLLIEKRIGTIAQRSSLYETKPWGKTDQPDFLNQVLMIKVAQTPAWILQAALHIEHEMGRARNEKWGARLIDIDLLYVGNQILQTDKLILPHPEIAQRRFVLEPLTEIAPDFIHPVLNKSQRQLLAECADTLKVSKI